MPPQSNPENRNVDTRHPLHPARIAATLMALRDTLLGLVLGLVLLVGIIFYQDRQSATAAVLPPLVKRVNTPAESQPATQTADQPAAISQPDSGALQALLDKWQSDYSYASFGVVVRELGGSGRSASLNADTSFNAASLYKLYLEDYLYTKIAEGSISLSDSLGAPEPLSDCLNLMIIYSDNTCGLDIGSTVGWVTLNNFVHGAGFNETTQSPVNTTSANDLANFLQELQSRTLIRSDFTDQLIDNMEKQIYRSAIPAGDPGVAVADKVGFIDTNWDDAAIVYGSKTTYILVVMSNGAGNKPIADLSQRVNDFMSQ